jgi:hypothetical protein
LGDDFIQARFFFPILSKTYYNWCKLTFVRRKGAGVFSSENPNELEIAGAPPEVERMRGDESLSKEFFSWRMELKHKPWVCTIGTEVLGQRYVGKINLTFIIAKRSGKKLSRRINSHLKTMYMVSSMGRA